MDAGLVVVAERVADILGDHFRVAGLGAVENDHFHGGILPLYMENWRAWAMASMSRRSPILRRTRPGAAPCCSAASISFQPA
ncbi:hypothetical protein D3C78_1837470 [compost metagenome]